MDQFPDVRLIDFGDKIEQLRELIYEYVNQDPGEVDLDDVRARITPPGMVGLHKDEPNSKVIRDWMLKRLLISAKIPLDLQSAMDKFVEVFQFRAQYQVSKLTLQNTLPAEFFPLGIYVTDKSMVDRVGNRLFIVRIKYHRKLPQLDVLIKRAMVYLIEQHDLEFEQGHFEGVTLLVDTQGFDYRHVSLDMMKFAVKLGFIYAGPIKSVLVYNLPWAFTFLLRMVETWVNLMIGFKLNIFHLVNRKTLLDFVNKEKLPEFLHGTKCINLKAPPSALPFAKLIDSLDGLIEQKNADKIYEYLNEIVLNN